MNIDTPVPERLAPAAPGVVTAATRRPRLASGLLRGVTRFAGGTAIATAGLLAGAVAYGLTETWVSEDARINLSLGVSIAVWFTAGRSWFRPSRWPRLMVVFGVSLAVGILIGFAVTRYLRWIGVSL